MDPRRSEEAICCQLPSAPTRGVELRCAKFRPLQLAPKACATRQSCMAAAAPPTDRRATHAAQRMSSHKVVPSHFEATETSNKIMQTEKVHMRLTTTGVAMVTRGTMNAATGVAPRCGFAARSSRPLRYVLIRHSSWLPVNMMVPVSLFSVAYKALRQSAGVTRSGLRHRRIAHGIICLRLGARRILGTQGLRERRWGRFGCCAIRFRSGLALRLRGRLGGRCSALGPGMGLIFFVIDAALDDARVGASNAGRVGEEGGASLARSDVEFCSGERRPSARHQSAAPMGDGVRNAFFLENTQDAHRLASAGAFGARPVGVEPDRHARALRGREERGAPSAALRLCTKVFASAASSFPRMRMRWRWPRKAPRTWSWRPESPASARSSETRFSIASRGMGRSATQTIVGSTSYGLRCDGAGVRAPDGGVVGPLGVDARESFGIVGGLGAGRISSACNLLTISSNGGASAITVSKRPATTCVCAS